MSELCFSARADICCGVIPETFACDVSASFANCEGVATGPFPATGPRTGAFGAIGAATAGVAMGLAAFAALFAATVLESWFTLFDCACASLIAGCAVITVGVVDDAYPVVIGGSGKNGAEDVGVATRFVAIDYSLKAAH